MKKTILLVESLVLMHLLHAQRNNVEFGIKGGINAANFKIDPSFNSNARVSLHLGGLAHVHVCEHFAVQPELMISGQGADYGNNEDKFTYLNLPLLAQVMFGDGFRIETGPQAGLLLNAKSKDGNAESDIDKNFKKGDLSWTFGGGYLSHSGFGVDVRYNLGITNISKQTADVRNRVWQFGVFYQFRDRR